MTLWLGIDPGPTRCGWALVEIDGARPPAFVAGGHHPAEDLRAQIDKADRVALEWLAPGLFERARHDSLIDTARVEGGLLWLLRAIDAPLIKLSAGQWRGDVCRNSSASDDLIAEVVGRRVTGLRALSATERAHVFDAIGVVLAAACGPGEQVRLALGKAPRRRPGKPRRAP